MLETVRASFSAPRKTIRNALSHALGIDSAQTVRALERAAIDPGARAETLGVPDFLRLAHALRVELTAGSSHAMPELPEVESLRRILVRTAVGRTIVSVRIGEKRLRRRVTADFGGAIAGRRIVKLSRRAKYLIVELDGDHVMLVHLGMSGSLTHRHDGFDADDFDPRHDHLEFSLDDASRLVYNDPRRFGMVRLVERAALASTAELKGLGPEPLSREFNADYLAAKARGRTACDQEPDHGSTNRRRYRQYLRVRDSVSGGRASDAAGRARDARRD